MPVSRWIIAVALGLAACLLQAQEHEDSGQNGANYNQEPAEEQPLGIPIRIIEDPIAAEARQRREAEAEQREKDDLLAQQGMNAATQAMNEATQSMKRAAWWSFFAVALGTVLLIWTLSLTRQANRAAQAAVDVTREIGEAQTRPYLGFNVVSGEVQVGKPLKFHVEITNHGSSPAFEVAVASNAVIRRSNWTWDDEESPVTGKRPSTYMHPKGSFTVFVGTDPPSPLSDEHVRVLRSGDSSVHASVIVFFEDVFTKPEDEPRKAEFRFEFSGDECFASGYPRIAREGNYST